MSKPKQRGRYKPKVHKGCENCKHCKLLKQGDMYCCKYDSSAYVCVCANFCPTENYMWCEGKKFIER